MHRARPAVVLALSLGLASGALLTLVGSSFGLGDRSELPVVPGITSSSTGLQNNSTNDTGNESSGNESNSSEEDGDSEPLEPSSTVSDVNVDGPPFSLTVAVAGVVIAGVGVMVWAARFA